MKVALCVCIKDEPDINEFITHYILLGFDKIFIYDSSFLFNDIYQEQKLKNFYISSVFRPYLTINQLFD